MYDYIIVGAGLSGAVFANKMSERGADCLVLDRRPHIAGNIYSENIEGIEVHCYGPHIFHTASKKVWDYVSNFTSFNNFIYTPIANYQGKMYPMPFNMHTFYALWGIASPEEAERKIESQKIICNHEPSNLEEKALSLVGRDIYEKLIKGYTEKQWGKSCKDLPASIIQRLPVRFVYDNNYFNHRYQGIPDIGYTAMIGEMLQGVDVCLNEDYLKNKAEWEKKAKCIFYTGPIDEYYEYCYGALEYRSLSFVTEVLNIGNYQGVAGMNFTGNEVPYTRVIEHKHFKFGEGNKNRTVITKEYPLNWNKGDEPYYPINSIRNNELYKKYKSRADDNPRLIFGGRLGKYRYFDMDQVVADTLEIVSAL